MLCDVLLDSWRSFLLNVRWTTYFSYRHYHGCICVIIILSEILIDSGHSFLLKVRPGQYILLSDTVIAEFVVDYYTV